MSTTTTITRTTPKTMNHRPSTSTARALTPPRSTSTSSWPSQHSKTSTSQYPLVRRAERSLTRVVWQPVHNCHFRVRVVVGFWRFWVWRLVRGWCAVGCAFVLEIRCIKFGNRAGLDSVFLVLYCGLFRIGGCFLQVSILFLHSNVGNMNFLFWIKFACSSFQWQLIHAFLNRQINFPLRTFDIIQN